MPKKKIILPSFTLIFTVVMFLLFRLNEARQEAKLTVEGEVERDTKSLDISPMAGIFEVTKALVRANNHPFVSADITDKGDLWPVSCIDDSASKSCVTDLTIMASHAVGPTPRSLSGVPSLEAVELYHRFFQKEQFSIQNIAPQYEKIFSQLQTKILKELEIKGRADLKKPFLKYAKTYVHVLNRITAGLSAQQFGSIACGDIAVKMYAKLLVMQSASSDDAVESIHVVMMMHKKSNYNHAFLLVNAELPDEQTSLELLEAKDKLKKAMIVDPYSGPKYAFLPFSSREALELHKSVTSGLIRETVRLPNFSELAFPADVRELVGPELKPYDDFLKRVLEFGGKPYPSPFDPELPFNKAMKAKQQKTSSPDAVI